MIKELIHHRDLLSLLVIREIRIRYARAFLGMAWALFIPLVMMLIFSAMNFGRLMPQDENAPFKDVPYALFAYCGLLFWTHFATSLTTGTPSVVIAAPLLKKCSFPREVIPLAKVLAAVLDLLVGAIFLAVLLVWKGNGVGWSLVVLPLIFALQVAFTSGLVLFLSALNMYFRDVNYLTQVGVLLLMFATSVVYPLPDTEGVGRVILSLNPMSSFLHAYREILLLGQWPGPGILVGIVGTVLFLVFGAWVFRSLSPHFAEEV